MKGQAFLALILLIGAVIAAVGATLAFVVFTNIDTSYGYQASQMAEAATTAGVEDGLLQVTRNPSFAGAYVLQAGTSTTANVTVTQNSPAANYITILAVATVSGKTRKTQAILSENTATLQVSINSWQEIQ